MKDINKLLKEIKSNNLDLIATQYNLDKKGRKKLEMYKDIYSGYWEHHFYQWWLWNTEAGKRQRHNYGDWLDEDK